MLLPEADRSQVEHIPTIPHILYHTLSAIDKLAFETILVFYLPVPTLYFGSVSAIPHAL